MNGSHIAGAGFGALVGTILVALGRKIGLDLTNFDSAALGVAALGVGLGIGHAIGEHGIIGIGQILLRGRAKPAVPQRSPVATSAVIAPTTLPPPTA